MWERARERETRTISPAFSSGRNQHPETYGYVTMATLQERRQQLGGVVTCGAGVRLVTKAVCGTSALKLYSGCNCSQSPSPSTSPTPTHLQHQHHHDSYKSCPSFSRLGLWLYLYAPHHTPSKSLLSPLLNPPSTSFSVCQTLEGTGIYLFLHIQTSGFSKYERFRQWGYTKIQVQIHTGQPGNVWGTAGSWCCYWFVFIHLLALQSFHLLTVCWWRRQSDM